MPKYKLTYQFRYVLGDWQQACWAGYDLLKLIQYMQGILNDKDTNYSRKDFKLYELTLPQEPTYKEIL